MLIAQVTDQAFQGRLQIWNPGFLPFDLTVETLQSGDYASQPRNRLIAQIFYDLEMIERYGSGIGRMNDACRDAELSIPTITNNSGGFMLTFEREASEKASEKTSERMSERTSERIVALLNIVKWCSENGNPAPVWSEDTNTVLVSFAPPSYPIR